jgi:hypothetical protein
MVFDIRGKRRHVVKVVYAILAVLMGLSLFLVVGPVNINALLGGGSSGGSSAATQFEEEAERIEIRLKKSPEDPDLLASLTRARINAGNSSVEITSQGQVITAETVQQYQLASEAWSRYLKSTNEPSPNVAQAVAPTLITLAEAAGVGEFEANIAAAVEAQEIVAKARPSVGTLSTLTIYQYVSADYAAARKTEAEAVALGRGKFERESIENKLQPYEKVGKELQKKLKEIRKAAKGVGNNGSVGTKETLESPLGGFGANALK